MTLKSTSVKINNLRKNIEHLEALEKSLPRDATMLKQFLDGFVAAGEQLEELLKALEFCRDIAKEEYPHQTSNVGAELALRHIIRTCEEHL